MYGSELARVGPERFLPGQVGDSVESHKRLAIESDIMGCYKHNQSRGTSSFQTPTGKRSSAAASQRNTKYHLLSSRVGALGSPIEDESSRSVIGRDSPNKSTSNHTPT